MIYTKNKFVRGVKEENRLDISKIREIQLSLLQAIHDFCEKEKLVYFLSDGTLIGAIRHKGYIPWDDDVDISMPRPDYDRFMRTFNQKGGNYKFICNELDSSYHYSFGKVIDTDTLCLEDVDDQYPLGVYVDVFPIDGIRKEDTKLLKKQIRLRQIRSAKNQKFNPKRSKLNNMLVAFSRPLLKVIPDAYLVRVMIKNSKKYKYEDEEYICGLSLGDWKQSMPKKWFDKTIIGEFEGRQYKIPVGYHEYLTCFYGEYMTLPPEDKRKPTHFFRAYRK